MDLQDLKKKPEPEAQKPSKKKYLILAAAAVVVIIAAVVGVNQSRETDRIIEILIDDLEDRADVYTLSYPVIGEQSGDYYEKMRTSTDASHWGEGGYFEKVKEKKKFAAAVADAIGTTCVYPDDEGEEKFHSTGFEKACRMAAVLEYVNYENEDVKAVMDNLMAQAAEAAKGDNWYTSKAVFMTFQKYGSLPYYGSPDALPKEEIEAAFAEQWAEVKREMPKGDADLMDFVEDVVEVATVAPITVPEYGAVKSSAAAAGEATAAEDISKTMYLDMDKMAPYDELLAALEENGEEAIFRNGEGGYYDNNREKGSVFGDFRSQYVSGKMRRTGKEDAFTEQYLRDHYDKPSKTYSYFKEEKISGIPTFYTDTERVFVYDGNVYAFTPYSVYTMNGTLVYDAETGKDAERKHLPQGEAEALMSGVDAQVQPFMQELSDFAPRYEYDIENNLVTVYLEAPQGTTDALKGDGQIPIRADDKMSWDDLEDYLCDLSVEMSSALRDVDDIRSAMWGTQEETGVGVILASDVDPDSGLLSILNGEVIQDHSQNPPAPAKAPTAEEEPEEAEED